MLQQIIFAIKTVSETLVEDALLINDFDSEGGESRSEADSSDESESDGSVVENNIIALDRISSTVVSNVAAFLNNEKALPVLCINCLKASISKAHAANSNTCAGRLGIRNAVLMRTVERDGDEGSEYILLDAPLQRRHTLLIDPLRLIACVCQDFVEDRKRPSSNSIDLEMLESSRIELYKQFGLDFPRLAMVVNGERLSKDLTAPECLNHLAELMGEELALQVLVLTTQGALAPIFNWVHSNFGDYPSGTHVTGGGSQEVHVQVKTATNAKRGNRKVAKSAATVEVLLLKPFQVIKVTQGEVLPQTDLWCQTRLMLSPFQGGEVTLSVPTERCQDPHQELADSVPIPITEGLLKMQPQQHHESTSFALTGDGRWEMVSRQYEC